MPSKRIIRCKGFIKAGTAVVTLLLVAACVTIPTPDSTLLTPEPADGLLAPQSTALVANAEEESPASFVPTEPDNTLLPIAVVAVNEQTPVTTAARPEYFQSAATYYAKRFKGRRTASGERYDPERMTAATRDFPLQTWLKVINPANGREVIVRVNDRTGKRKTPLIDLSRAAAKELGFLGKGKIQVNVIPVPAALQPPLVPTNP